MRTLTNAAIFQRDPALPGLSIMFDVHAFAERIKPLFGNEKPLSFRIQYVRYKPQKSCLALYELKTKHDSFEFYAKAHPAMQWKQILKSGDDNPKRIVLEESGIILYVLPHDKQLKAIKRLMPPRSNRFSSEVLQGFHDYSEMNLSILRYLPERRFVAQLSISDKPAIVVKIYGSTEYERIRETYFRLSANFRIPQRLGQSDRWRAVAYRWMPGETLGALISRDDFDVKVIRSVAGALAEIHAQKEDRFPLLSHKEEAASLFALGGHLQSLNPLWKSRIDDFTHKAMQHLLLLPVLTTPIHGDFNPQQVVIDHGSVGILDFDRAALGQPALDLGNFLAHLEYKVLLDHLSIHTARSVEEAFLREYETFAPLPFGISLYKAIALFRLTPTPFRNYEDSWAERTELILEQAGRLLEAVHTEET